MAERLRTKIERHAWPHGPICVSIGIATAVATTSDAEEVLHEADVALYLAKQNGRNRVYHVLDTAEPREA